MGGKQALDLSYGKTHRFRNGRHGQGVFQVFRHQRDRMAQPFRDVAQSLGAASGLFQVATPGKRDQQVTANPLRMVRRKFVSYEVHGQVQRRGLTGAAGHLVAGNEERITGVDVTISLRKGRKGLPVDGPAAILEDPGVGHFPCGTAQAIQRHAGSHAEAQQVSNVRLGLEGRP
jgi:hypothetical protein